PAVFVVKKDIQTALDQSSLAFRQLQLWQVQPEEINSLRVQRQNETEYRLARDGSNWKLSGPFDATVNANQVQTGLTNLAPLRGERFESHVPKELGAYGLDKPYLRLALSTEEKKEEKKKEPGNDKKTPAGGKEEPRERVPLI